MTGQEGDAGPGRLTIAALCCFVTVGCAGGLDGGGPPLRTAAPALDGQRFQSRIGDFDTDGTTLAVMDGSELVLIPLDGQPATRRRVDIPVTALAFDGEGGLWLVGRDATSLWRSGRLACRAEDLGDSLNILQTAGDHIELGREVYIDGSGVFGERITIDGACGVVRDPMVRPAMTVVARIDDNRRLVALGAKIDAGPTRLDGPRLQLRDGDRVMAEMPVFADQPDIDRVSALAAGDDRILALAGDGRFELLGLSPPRPIKSGRLPEPADRLLSVEGTSRVIAGRVLVDLLSGETRLLLSAGSIEDVTADQSWWLVDDGEALSLRSAKSLDQR